MMDWSNKSSGDYNGGSENCGVSFGKGRGFNRNTNDNRNSGSGGWSQSRDNNDSGSSFGQNNYDGERRGRGGGRGRGGRYNRNDNNSRDEYNSGGTENNSGWSNDEGNRGGGGGYNQNDDDNSRWGNNDRSSRGGGYDQNDNDNSRFSRGRGGGGRGRGGRNRGGDDDSRDDSGDSSWKDDNKGDNENENGEVKERPPIYVPEERSVEQIFDEKGISTGINFDAYENIPITVNGEGAPAKIHSFDEAGFRDIMLQNLKRCGYTKPTPIQKISIPIVMAGRDLMATAQTGSGKTGAFLLPIIHRLLSEGDSSTTDGNTATPSAVIVSPTRELAIQIHENARRYATGSFLKIQIAYGGTAVRFQLNQIMRGCHILVATPGRLNDFVEKGAITFGSIKFVVLDEADRMLDMGFRSDMERLIRHSTMSDQRQTLMFSATFEEQIQRLAGSFLSKDYIFVNIGVVGGACTDVEQNFIPVSRNDKKKVLMELLRQENNVEGTLLFVGQKRNADFIASFLSEKGFKTTSIHGDRFQSQREEALRDFRTRRMAILVATSVAARGLDISGVTHVINYDLPQDVEEYVHRIGRTGRLGNKGKATSFYDDTNDTALALPLVRILKQANQKVPDFLGDVSSGGGFDNNGSGAVDYRQEGSYQRDDVPKSVNKDEVWD